MNLTHKGYVAEATYYDDDEYMHGLVQNVCPTTILHFCGRSIEEVKEAFAGTITFAWCAKRNVEPARPYIVDKVA